MLKSLLPCLQYACQPRAVLARLSVSTAANAARTHYEVLGLQRSATAEDIKNAFRQKAKELHPDLNADYTAADGDAFMQLVAAYEVLSDPEQRQLYDIASSSQLPEALRRAAAAAAGSAGSSPATDTLDTTTADPFGWRYGLSDWARHGPENNVPAMPEDARGFKLQLLSALARHRKDLEHDLHAALLKAFLGPKLEVAPGQLPPAFEADERAHPALSHNLLHLVHGRTLLGAVRIQQPLQIAGDEAAATAALPGSAAQQLTAATCLSVTAAEACSTSQNRAVARDKQLTDLNAALLLQQLATNPNIVTGPAALAPAAAAMEADVTSTDAGATAVDAVATHPLNSNAAEAALLCAAAAAPDPNHYVERGNKSKQEQLSAASIGDDEAEIEVSEWQELLQQQHPLRGTYDWMPPPPLQLSAALQEPVPTCISSFGIVQHAPLQQAMTEGTGAGGSGGSDGNGKAAVGRAGEAPALHDHLTLGGQSTKVAWEEAWQQQHGCTAGVVYDTLVGCSEPCQPVAEGTAGSGVPCTVRPTAGTADATNNVNTANSSSQLHRPLNQPGDAAQHCPSICSSASAAPDSSASKSEPQQAELKAAGPQQHAHQQEQWMAAETCGDSQASQQAHNGQWQKNLQDRGPVQQQQQQQQQRQRYQRQARWLHQRRLWRWVRYPTPDWSAADWEFDDSSEGVLVLQLLMAGGRVAAVAVRDDKQPAKPTKVYINGSFAVAILDDIVMEPLTGRLMGVLYKYYTPGVHHLYFYLPGTQGSRVLARLQRRWMPPSSTWLFPPVSESHDRGGWVVEWEGHRAEDKPGWMHPAVFVLTAGLYSYNLEGRRLQGNSKSELQGQLWEQASDLGRRLAQVLRWLQGKTDGQT